MSTSTTAGRRPPAPPRTSRWWRAALATVVAVTALALTAVTSAGPAGAAEDSTARFLSWVNHERAGRGLPSLRPAVDLGAVALAHSQEMARVRRVHHNLRVGQQVGGWERLAENVGAGGSVDSVHAALMASPDHRPHILDARMSEIGLAVVWTDRMLWVTQVFRKPMVDAIPSVVTVSLAPAQRPAPPREPRPSAVAQEAPPDRDQAVALPEVTPAPQVGPPSSALASPALGSFVPVDGTRLAGTAPSRASAQAAPPAPLVLTAAVLLIGLLAGRRLWAARRRTAPR